MGLIDSMIVHTFAQQDLRALCVGCPEAVLSWMITRGHAQRYGTAGISEFRYEEPRPSRRQGLGADFISMRRLAELLGAISLGAYAELTRLVAADGSKNYFAGAERLSARVQLIVPLRRAQSSDSQSPGHSR